MPNQTTIKISTSTTASPQLPLRKTVVMSALIKCLAVQVFAHPGVIAQRLAQRVLHSPVGWAK